MKKIIPAILTDDLKDLKAKLKKLKGLTDWIQIDIMDGKFVKKKSIKIKNILDLKIPFRLEFHLMVKNPET